ncbi:MAG TPA: hypothetical protein VOA64_03930 [Candidatus Dormibacteraeota bacterium]|nr:hypothetical protein [Candidatus Dormibacteraeota bacterium]
MALPSEKVTLMMGMLGTLILGQWVGIVLAILWLLGFLTPSINTGLMHVVIIGIFVSLVVHFARHRRIA